MQTPPNKIAIVGGGTAGWMAAAALSKALPIEKYQITVIESADIPSIGVGEATIPPIESFNNLLGIDKYELLRATQGTFKLGIEFLNWGEIGDSYYHPFGTFGTSFDNTPFHQSWVRAKNADEKVDLESFSINALLAREHKFTEAKKIPNSPLNTINHAYHFDAKLYAGFLRRLSVANGVIRIEDTVTSVKTNSSNGFISQLNLEKSPPINADFFIDCSGFKGLLIEETLQTGYEDWSHFLHCNSAIAVASEKITPLPSHTKAIAHGFGWQWKIPLQHRTGNGFVYSSNYCSDDYAQKTLIENLQTPQISEAKRLRFTTGKRLKTWNKNCLSLGLASGFLEPLESTSIHLIQSSISKFLGLFPDFNNFEHEQKRFNKLIDQEMLAIRDFLILHYKATSRDDTAFWRYCKDMEIPDSLQEKIDLYSTSAHLYKDNYELFAENSWFSVLNGQGITPSAFSPLANNSSISDLNTRLNGITNVIKKCVDSAPSHDEYISKHCKAPKP